MDNSKNSGKSILRFVFLLITLILIVWAFWPERRTIEKVPLKITSQNGLDSSDEFQLINQLNEYQVVINSPVSIEMKKMENIVILLEKTSQAGRKPSEGCRRRRGIQRGKDSHTG